MGTKKNTGKDYSQYSANFKKLNIEQAKRNPKFFSNNLAGTEITEHGIKPNEEKIYANLQLKPPKSSEELKSFLGAIHYIAKFLPKLS